MIAIILGGAPSVWTELAKAKALLGARPHIIAAANLAGIHFRGHLDGWATLHAEMIEAWTKERGERAARTFTPVGGQNIEAVAERWPGSSGLYALQIALFEMGAAGAVLCGVPMETTAGHFANPGPWASVTSYRRAFCQALPEIGGRVRSLGGWTRDLFGAPTPSWLDAISTARPSRPASTARRPMFKVENIGQETASFWHTDPLSGLRKLAHVGPGESGTFEIDPRQSAFQREGLTVTEIVETAPVPPNKRAKTNEIEPRADASPLP